MADCHPGARGRGQAAFLRDLLATIGAARLANDPANVRKGSRAPGRDQAGSATRAAVDLSTTKTTEAPAWEIALTVFGYIRTSKPPKKRSRHSSSSSPLGIESQREAILAAYPEAVLHVDEFRSGRRATRPALRAMVEQLERGDLVIVARLDRLARSMRLAMALEHEIEDVSGARIVSLAGEGTSADGKPDPYAVFVRRVHQAAAELQVAQAARTTQDALAVRRRNGYAATGSPPWGFRLQAGKLVPDPSEQKALDLARAWVARCAATPAPADLARALTKAGARNRKGRPIGRDTAGRILRQLEQDTTNTTPQRRAK